MSPKNPVEVGGYKDSEGPRNERRFLNALAGPNGEKISYYRAGSCCPVKSDNDPFGFGSVMLDNYRVTWENSKDTVSIYINMYDSGKLKAPIGFTIKK
ncbi:2-dehydro-3-deoxyphosphooctonate aldolase [Flaviramulus sp. BrNp1-15]|uniref:2-dehydro-3-deoxyphosphooctonate aldolase n=1 Tax=Flaviramulus sp. BrNp1-15 TaxID=2916754 RepID=UPI001EE88A47|nr:2-dehydro-3-deoxyphosphooctonate aldolase [Flaviramulus sp. BrNp1-15]ULC59337.1 2-dehydro-3-deoxyphosphooctonate aldolase [Flaviramulus sp. BrNp1-15]